MPCTVEVLFTPAEFRALRDRDLAPSVCVVFDVLRTTSTFVTALAHGAAAIIPVEEISEALDLRRRRPEVLLAGERHGRRIGADLTGGVAFDLGNSPREYTREKVAGRTIVSTTTNGTRALRACAGAGRVLMGSFLNLGAVAAAVRNRHAKSLVLVCAGTGEGAALEDALAAGAVCETLANEAAAFHFSDSAAMARKLWLEARSELRAVVSETQNGRRLLADVALSVDVDACLRVDSFAFAPGLNRQGHIVRQP